MTSLLRPALTLSLLIAPALVGSSSCKQPGTPAARPNAGIANRPTVTHSKTDDGLMKATFTCPKGKPEYKVEGQTVTVNCPD